MSISDRLKQLLLERSWSTRRFQEEVKGRAGEGTRGVSYASVWEYVEGKTDPPLSFLRVAAEVLGVREGWLATGEGHPTDGHAAEAHVAETVAADVAEDVLAEIRLGFAGEDSEEGNWLESNAIARAALVHAWRRRREGFRNRIGASVTESLDPSVAQAEGHPPAEVGLAREVGAALRATLDALNVDQTQVPSDAREDFVMGMVQAITALVHVPYAK